jgi:hypothetical protein
MKCSSLTTEDGCEDNGCFWLNSLNSKDNGSCKDKDDSSSLKCSDAKMLSDCGKMKSFLGKDCVWVELHEQFEGCLDVEVTCSDLSYFVCESYMNSSQSVTGLSVYDAPCFFNGEDKKEMSCVSKNDFSEERCSMLRSMKICNGVEEIGWTMKCAWIKIANYSSCIVDGTAELCEYYVQSESCKKTSVGEICSWDSITGKCTSGLKSCDLYKSYNACSAVGDRCFWNGNSTSLEGECLSLEKEYECSNLRYSVCNTYGYVDGLIVRDKPCFFNGPADDDKLHCVSTWWWMRRTP